jgi:hypothetical protein
MPDLLERLRHLPKHTVVLIIAIGRDAAGTPFESSETGPLISAAANAPVFGLSDLYLGHGEVGGDLADLSHQGKIAANEEAINRGWARSYQHQGTAEIGERESFHRFGAATRNKDSGSRAYESQSEIGGSNCIRSFGIDSQTCSSPS